MRCVSVGPRDAAIAIIGEAPGEQEEEARGVPFVGVSGYELDRMLADAGIVREKCFIANAVADRPAGNDLTLWVNKNKTAREGEVRYRNKWVRQNVARDIEELHGNLRAINPRVIIPVGNTALWAVTPHNSIDKWRGSLLRSDVPGVDGTVCPTYHPAAVLRQYEWRYITVRDLRRAATVAEKGCPVEPERRFRVCDTYAKALEAIAELRSIVDLGPTIVVCDLEIKRREIVCLGLGWSRYDAACIAFYGPDGRIPTAEQTAELWLRLWQLFSHPNCRLVNQNLAFDITFMFESAFTWPQAWFDTMIAQNVLFPGTPKSLDYLASLYCEHYVYWKDDGKFWDKPIVFPQLWRYNMLDCVYTYEVQECQRDTLSRLGLEAQMAFQLRLFRHAMVLMFRGVRVSAARKEGLRREIADISDSLALEVNCMSGTHIDPFSPKQVQDFFYKRMGCPTIVNRKTKRPTVDDDALAAIGRKDPILALITTRLNMIRSYKTALSVCQSRADADGRWRCSFNLAGTENFRWSSSSNPYGSGLNLQNLTVGKEITK